MISTEKMNEVWGNLIKKHDYNAVLEAIKSNPEDLLNAIHPKGYSLFSMVIKFSKKEKAPEKLIKFIATNDNFNLNNTNKKETNIESLISMAQYVVSKLLIANPSLVYDGEKLTYTSVKKALELAKNNISYSESRVDRLKKMLELVRGATIHLAIKQDNVELLKRLEKEGGCVTSLLRENNELPNELLTENSTEVNKFYAEKYKVYNDVV